MQVLLYTLTSFIPNVDSSLLRYEVIHPMHARQKIYQKNVRQLNKAQEFYEENDGLFDFEKLAVYLNLKKDRA